ncbi:unnamed protein product [marine sediment metagenome]|uniref:Holin n=1 Tax=marine sediment metagenome TaxID=412755 RepID=X0XKI4_9ZZZZ
MQELMKGKKTYLVAGATAILWFLETVGLVSPGTFEAAQPLIMAAGASTFAAKLNRK